MFFLWAPTYPDRSFPWALTFTYPASSFLWAVQCPVPTTRSGPLLELLTTKTFFSLGCPVSSVYYPYWSVPWGCSLCWQALSLGFYLFRQVPSLGCDLPRQVLSLDCYLPRQFLSLGCSLPRQVLSLGLFPTQTGPLVLEDNYWWSVSPAARHNAMSRSCISISQYLP